MLWWIPILIAGVVAGVLTNHILSPADLQEVGDYAPFAGAVLATVFTAVMGYLVSKLNETRHSRFGQTLRRQHRNSSALAVPLRRSMILLVSLAVIAAGMLLFGFFKDLLPAYARVWGVSTVIGAIVYGVGATTLIGYWYLRVDHFQQVMRERDAKAERRKHDIAELRRNKPSSSGEARHNPPLRMQGHIQSNGP